MNPPKKTCHFRCFVKMFFSWSSRAPPAPKKEGLAETESLHVWGAWGEKRRELANVTRNSFDIYGCLCGMLTAKFMSFFSYTDSLDHRQYQRFNELKLFKGSLHLEFLIFRRSHYDVHITVLLIVSGWATNKVYPSTSKSHLFLISWRVVHLVQEK